MNADFKYPGHELELFANAAHWKMYVTSTIQSFLKGSVVEMGAGTGNFSPYLQKLHFERWVYIEPDKRFRGILQAKIQDQVLVPGLVAEDIGNLQGSAIFDTILYLDVLEHIEDDRNEINRALDYLRPGGHIIVLSPAFNSLYSAFDKEIGHFRRYSCRGLSDLFPNRKNIRFSRYLDSMGYFTSLANRVFLNQKYPTVRQVQFWDRFVIPVSTIADKWLFHSFGRSILVIWQKQ